MTLYINQCSNQFNTTDPDLELFRKIIFSVIIFEIASVMVLRIVSGFKNYDLFMIKKQLEEKKKIEERAIFQTIQNLNDLTQHNQTIMTLIGKTQHANTSMKIIKKDSINQNGIDTIVLEKDVKKSKEIKLNEEEKAEEISEDSNSSEQSEANEQNDEDSKESSTDQLQEHELIFQESMNFINVFNIKLSLAQASNFFNIVLGHFFISAAMSIPHAPSIFSTAFSIAHGILFVLLIVANACGNSKKNRVGDQIQSENKKENYQHERNPSSNLMAETDSKKITESQAQTGVKCQEKPLKRKISFLIMALMSIVSLILLSFSVTQLKQSYFNLQQNKCQ